MSPSGPGHRVAVVGASSLLGKELLAVLRERRFPVARLVEIEGAGDSPSEPEPPVLDLEESAYPTEFGTEVEGGEIDLAFIAAQPETMPRFLRAESARPPLLIDLEASLPQISHEPPRIAFLDAAPDAPPAAPAFQNVAAAAPATIVLSVLLLRLVSRAHLSTAAAHVFSPASHLGTRGIDELQKQTVNLLSFQKIPRTIFGNQLAFNLLAHAAGTGANAMSRIEARVHRELERYLGGRALHPALRLFQTPVFYSLAVSLYVETVDVLTPAEASEALAGERVRLRRGADRASSQVETTGRGAITVGPVLADASRDRGLWVWAVADDLRLAAQNAVELAEQFTGPRVSRRPASRAPKAG